MGVKEAFGFSMGIVVCLVCDLTFSDNVTDVDIININSVIERCPSQRYSNITITNTIEEVHYKTEVLCMDGLIGGFNPLEGDWAERLFLSQAATYGALKQIGEK